MGNEQQGMSYAQVTALFGEAVQSMKNRVVLDMKEGRTTVADGGRLIGVIEAARLILEAWPVKLQELAQTQAALLKANDSIDYWRLLFQVMLMRAGHFDGNQALVDDDEAERSTHLFLNVATVTIDGKDYAAYTVVDPPTVDQVARAH